MVDGCNIHRHKMHTNIILFLDIAFLYCLSVNNLLTEVVNKLSTVNKMQNFSNVDEKKTGKYYCELLTDSGVL